ncbi:hypothetical protein BH10ACT9_BH10ACT9_02880 [soil metagenome]
MEAEFIQARLITEGLPELRDDPTARIRPGLASSMLVGVIVGRRLVQVPTLAEADIETMVALLAPAMQAVLNGADQP